MDSAIREALAFRPFRPFVVHVSDGRNLGVPGPEFVSIGPRQQTMVVWRPDGGFSIVHLASVTEIEFPGA